MNRVEQLKNLTSIQEWDIIIIGGGATGLGCAVDAASRGYKTLLLEKYDFAKGTSSRATKLIHGGVRYLAQGNIKLVTEALRERGTLLKNAPHVCHTQKFIIPCYSWWSKFYYGIGLKIYDILAGKRGLGKTRIVSNKYVLANLPGVKKENLKGGIEYTDGQFDDARLAVNLAQTAFEQGGTVLNYLGVVSFIFENDKVTGLNAFDSINKMNYQLKAKVIINATGVFAESVMKLAKDNTHSIAASQGVHVVVDKKHFTGSKALMIPKTTDGRVLFAVPWNNEVIIGTTDTPVNETPVEPIALPQEIDFIIHNFNNYSEAPISHNDVKAVFSGLRPLVKKEGIKNTAALNRNHAIIISSGNLVTITGGKWTTYRKMAEDAVNNACYIAKLEKERCKTTEIRIHGYLNEPNRGDFLNVYGSDSVSVKELAKENTDWNKPLHPNYPYIIAQVIWAIRNEMAQTVEDILARRIRLLFLDAHAAAEAAPVVAALLKKELNETDAWEKFQVEAFKQLTKKYLI